MDFVIESSFIRKCIKKEYQERLLFELQSKKHREKALSRFAHSSEILLKYGFEKIHISSLCNYLPKNNSESFYIISGDLHDGKKLLCKDAIGLLNISYTPVILISPLIIVIKEEVENKQTLLFVYQSNS